MQNSGVKIFNIHVGKDGNLDTSSCWRNSLNSCAGGVGRILGPSTYNSPDSSVVVVSLGTADVSPRSSPLRDVSREGTSATQQQKFHTDDVNQCLHNKSGSHGVPNANLFNFTFLLVDFGKVLCSSANELQQNSNASSREDYIPHILTVLLEIHRVYI